MWVGGPNSRILQNYSDGYDGVSTLAHELGHAYHNLTQSDLQPLLHATPMCLAETASTFCETIIKEAALEDASVNEQTYILEQSLQGSGQIVVDIISRFDFERAICAQRLTREVDEGFSEFFCGCRGVLIHEVISRMRMNAATAVGTKIGRRITAVVFESMRRVVVFGSWTALLSRTRLRRFMGGVSPGSPAVPLGGCGRLDRCGRCRLRREQAPCRSRGVRSDGSRG